MLADYHMHTSFSDDSVLPMQKAVEQAINLKLDEICFTEHINAVYNYHDCNCREYQTEIKRCREIFKDKISIKFGMEFGLQSQLCKYFETIFNNYEFDFIILSVHLIKNLELWNQDYQHGKTQDEYNRGYYEELLNVVENYNDYSVLGHMDLIRRYDKISEYPFEKSRDIIEKILKTVIKNDKGIEINTSSFRYGLSDLMPSCDILKLYEQLGGKIITIGSDSHRIEHIGYNIPFVHEKLKTLGYTHFCTFNKMRPVFHKLT